MQKKKTVFSLVFAMAHDLLSIWAWASTSKLVAWWLANGVGSWTFDPWISEQPTSINSHVMEGWLLIRPSFSCHSICGLEQWAMAFDHESIIFWVTCNQWWEGWKWWWEGRWWKWCIQWHVLFTVTVTLDMISIKSTISLYGASNLYFPYSFRQFPMLPMNKEFNLWLSHGHALLGCNFSCSLHYNKTHMNI